MNAQADLNLRMADVFIGMFSDVAAHTFYDKHTIILDTTEQNIKNSEVSRTKQKYLDVKVSVMAQILFLFTKIYGTRVY